MTGKGKWLLGVPGGATSLGISERCLSGAAPGQVETGKTGDREGTALPGTPLASQGDPGKGCESPREVELKTGDLLVLAGEAAELNVSFVPPSPGRWRELGWAGGADTARCAHGSFTAPGLGTESCRLTNPLRACCKQPGSQHEQLEYLGKAFPFGGKAWLCPASRIRLCHNLLA